MKQLQEIFEQKGLHMSHFSKSRIKTPITEQNALEFYGMKSAPLDSQEIPWDKILYYTILDNEYCYFD